MRKILFICTGNYYRSRFAEAWFNFKKGPKLKNWHAISRGLMTECAPSSISRHTEAAIAQNHIPSGCYGKKPTPLTEDELNTASLVIAMKRKEHRPMMREQFPEWTDKIRYWDVHDLDVWKPNQTLPAIEIQVGLLIAEIAYSSDITN